MSCSCHQSHNTGISYHTQQIPPLRSIWPQEGHHGTPWDATWWDWPCTSNLHQGMFIICNANTPAHICVKERSSAQHKELFKSRKYSSRMKTATSQAKIWNSYWWTWRYNGHQHILCWNRQSHWRRRLTTLCDNLGYKRRTLIRPKSCSQCSSLPPNGSMSSTYWVY